MALLWGLDRQNALQMSRISELLPLTPEASRRVAGASAAADHRREVGEANDTGGVAADVRFAATPPASTLHAHELPVVGCRRHTGYPL